MIESVLYSIKLIYSYNIILISLYKKHENVVYKIVCKKGQRNTQVTFS